MADPRSAQQPHQQQPQPTSGFKSLLPQQGPSRSQVIALLTLFPLGGFLLLLAGITLTASVISLAIATPLFVIFSPIIVPAALTVALVVTGFLTSGAFGVTALSSMSWLINYIRRVRGSLPEHMDHAKRRLHDTAGYMGQKVEDSAQETTTRT